MKKLEDLTCIGCKNNLWVLWQGQIYCRNERCKRYGLVTTVTRETPTTKENKGKK